MIADAPSLAGQYAHSDGGHVHARHFDPGLLQQHYDHAAPLAPRPQSADCSSDRP